MLKKIFSVLCAVAVIIFTATPQAQAMGDIKVGVILDTPAGNFSEPEKVYTTTQATLDLIFKNDTQFDVMGVSECDSYVQIYREEIGLAATYDDTNYSTAQRDLTFKKEDIAKMCDHFDTNYVVYIRVSTTHPRSTGGVFTSGQKVNVVTDFRIWSRAKNDFVYVRRATTTGSSNTVNISIFGRGSGSAEHAVEKGLKKGLKEIEKDAAKIREAMVS